MVILCGDDLFVKELATIPVPEARLEFVLLALLMLAFDFLLSPSIYFRLRRLGLKVNV